jgi:peptidoglycan/LPS O-acetylase OafA/YrhL
MSASNLIPVSARSSTFRADIQGLRAIAIILVIALHMNLAGFSAGFIGVDIFFVVSGYVITLSMLKKTEQTFFRNLGNFWKSRFIRIFPAAALVICITVVAAFFFSGKAFNPDLLDDARWATFYASNFRLIFTGSNYFIAGLDQSLLTHYWALALEQQFYLIYPLLIFSVMALVRARLLVLRVVLIALVMGSSVFSIIQTQLDPVASYYSPFTRFWELAFGALLATFTIKPNKFLAWLGLVILVVSMFILGPTSQYPGYLAWLPAIGTGLLLLFPLQFLAITPLRYIGDISYSLYLWHFIWLVLPTQIENPITDYSWAFLLGAVICAVLTYHFYERPIHKSVSLKADGYSALSLALICLLTSWLVIEIIENLYLKTIL